jgi:hypothetical protein
MLLQSTAITATQKDLPTDPSPSPSPSSIPGEAVGSGNSNATGASVGVIVAPGSVGVADGEADGETDGRVVVGAPVEGDADGEADGDGVGDMVGRGVGAGVGLVEGSEVAKTVQVLESVFEQTGVKSSNCCKVSKTAANPQIDPELLERLIPEEDIVLPKTTAFETPTTLFRKQTRSKVKGPKVSMMKLLVVAWVRRN